MRTILERPVVVGVDGSQDAIRAVEFAALEAERLGCGVWIVAAVHEIAAYPSVAPLLTGESMIDVGRGIVADASRAAEGRAPTVPLDASVVVGAASTILAEAGRQGRMIVLGHRDTDLLEHVFTGSTTIGVVGRATCPVVSVPASWSRDRTHGRVIAAVDGSTIAPAVLTCALEAAEAHDADVTVLHYWDVNELYSPFGDIKAAQREWETTAGSRIKTLLDQLTPRYPGVRARLELEYARPADALVRRSGDVDRIVMGRHGGTSLLAGIIALAPGGVARALLQHARCPVEVVPSPVVGVSPETMDEVAAVEAADAAG
ncbi:universal stress protein [Luteimicrobium sp. NPDC057192]|uniref:universal stress protein n=1 Tax=Luteimicrobium sp. NPDC057192 TaxID=3346042 RepID=UPI0036316E8B